MLFFTKICIALQPIWTARCTAIFTPPAVETCAPSKCPLVVVLGRRDVAGLRFLEADFMMREVEEQCCFPRPGVAQKSEWRNGEHAMAKVNLTARGCDRGAKVEGILVGNLARRF